MRRNIFIRKIFIVLISAIYMTGALIIFLANSYYNVNFNQYLPVGTSFNDYLILNGSASAAAPSNGGIPGPYVQIVGEKINDPNAFEYDFSQEKTILIWGTSGLDFSQQNLGGCPDWNCRFDENLANESDAIIFYNFMGHPPAPEKRRPEQYYVFFTLESPTNINPHEPYPKFFNLTMTFRRDSDAPCVYGYSIHRPIPFTESSPFWLDLTQKLRRKTKSVAWVVSNCGADSERDKYVNELRKYIQVDIFGSCGTLNCARNDQNKSCDHMLENDYKFYLAFENSVCKDYSTEKFWHKLSLNMLIVVLKKSIIENYAPPNSFLAIDQFRSPKKLAQYLKKLDSNFDLYLNHFKWQLKYESIFLNGINHDHLERPWGFCKICQILQQKRPQYKNVYTDVAKWWSHKTCDNSLVRKILKRKFV